MLVGWLIDGWIWWIVWSSVLCFRMPVKNAYFKDVFGPEFRADSNTTIIEAWTIAGNEPIRWFVSIVWQSDHINVFRPEFYADSNPTIIETRTNRTRIKFSRWFDSNYYWHLNYNQSWTNFNIRWMSCINLYITLWRWDSNEFTNQMNMNELYQLIHSIMTIRMIRFEQVWNEWMNDPFSRAF